MDHIWLSRMATDTGFIAALDQSGGSTPGALARYGVEPSSYHSTDEMFDLIHAFRERIITSPSFTGEKVLGAILFEQTMLRDLDGVGIPEYLWQRKHVVPFLKVDQGLAEASDDARVMLPMPDLDALLERAVNRKVFGTKMRSVVLGANLAGVNAVLDQQFQVAEQILAAGLMPIIEPEVDIKAADKATAEAMVTVGILDRLTTLPEGTQVMLKLTIPSEPDLYHELIQHPAVLRVVALSGGYPQAEANRLLSQNPGLIASFSRALTEGLRASMSDAEFDVALAASIQAIYAASIG
jgi:fructose-bisphosphate aldolase, class I